jgi:uncharacterized protein YggE
VDNTTKGRAAMRWQIGLATAAAAAMLAVPAADAQAPPAKSVTTVGIGTASVTPKDRKSNASIKEAVEAADTVARPKAITSARERATELAQAAGLTLGGITSVSEASQFPYYGPFGAPYALQGTFGPGKFCGSIRTSRVKRDANGNVHRVLGKRHRVCRFPHTINVSLTVTFAAS